MDFRKSSQYRHWLFKDETVLGKQGMMRARYISMFVVVVIHMISGALS
jgi:hypothetical protein